MDPQISSEEKLLKLIRKKDLSDTSKQDDIVESGKQKADKTQRKTNIDFLLLINRFFVLALIGLFVFFGMDFFFLEKNKQEATKTKKASSKKGDSDILIAKPNTKQFKYYSDIIVQRDVFKLPWDKTKDVPVRDARPSKAVINDYKLVGIVLDEDPKVILEDPKGKETIFLSVGETLKNAMLIEVKEDMAVFKVGDNKVKLMP